MINSMTRSSPAPEVAEDVHGWTEGVFLIDKPAGLTSFAIIRRVRRLLGIKKVGHAGTLDPLATGLLIVCAGRAATKHIDLFMGGRKTYLAQVQLGVETDTLDAEGTVIQTSPVAKFDASVLATCLHQHAGPQMQAPPAFSAAKHQGKPLYAYARKGIMIAKEAKAIEIYRLDCLAYDPCSQQLSLLVECSRGTYIRVLAADIGQSLGCGAHLVGLRRTQSGQFSVDDSLPGAALLSDNGLQCLQDGRRSIDEVLKIVEQSSF